MAVYTDITDDELAEFLARYDIGEVLSFKGIAEGVENSNFLLHTDAGFFILTLYEKRVREGDLPFFLGLMEHLADHGINCPQPVKSRDGAALGRLAGKPAAVVTFLDGMWPRRPGVRHCAALGEALARMHVAGADFHLSRENALSVAGWTPLFRAAEMRADEVLPGLPAIAEDVPGFSSVVWFGVLAPRGTSDEIVAKMNAAIVKAVARPEVRKLFIERNVEPRSSTPAELEATIRAELAQWEPVVRKANLRE